MSALVLGHHLKERTSNQAIFLLEEKSLHTYVPYLLLPYGKSIQVIEPQSLKGKTCCCCVGVNGILSTLIASLTADVSEAFYNDDNH